MTVKALWVSLVVLLAGCASAPTVLTKTVTETVEVEKIIPVPAELSRDCPAAPVTGTTIGAALARLARVETALAQCREQMGMIRGLPH